MKNNTTQWKVGDWCFCEFKLQQIIEAEEGRVTSVSDGFFNHGSHSLNDRCFPLSLFNKRASDEAENWSALIHKMGTGLNYPDIHRKLVALWYDICEGGEERAEETFKALSDFGMGVQKAVDASKRTVIADVRLYK